MKTSFDITISIIILVSISLAVSTCDSDARQIDSSIQTSDQAVVLKEAFHTERDESNNVDSPAIWHGPGGENWLLATAKGRSCYHHF
jgi:3-phytase